jgi:hypothetical protein
MEAYDLGLNPMPPMVIPAVPSAVFLINSLLFVILLVFRISVNIKFQNELNSYKKKKS